MVSIHRPLGYGPSTLPLRHAALVCRLAIGRYPSIQSRLIGFAPRKVEGKNKKFVANLGIILITFYHARMAEWSKAPDSSIKLRARMHGSGCSGIDIDA